ncbi:RDD family protein [Capillimicrobium parvum]|uniref:RDD domain-containing protein n=1 Tax=Capillimicrobium parvum TaxID=2884022 RepID=A0A9E6XY84_9ACTN|nr:RDD family protein [Capillimicrobium parvum]UGS36722.1 hypothetical protein DSM104329_03131 [Capillimicrobium parvum]
MSATVPPVPPAQPVPGAAPVALATTRAPPVAEPVVVVTGPYAGLATRTLAFAADAIVINVVGWFVAAIVTLCLSLLSLPSSVKDVLLVIGAGIALVWTASYFCFFWSTTGQTPGNRLMRIRVVEVATGQPIKPRRAFGRMLGLVLSALLLCTGFLLILFDGRRRALHDRLSGTIVADVAAEPPIRTVAPPRRTRR